MNTKRGEAFLAPRRGLSCIKKGMFLNVKGRSLECRRACTGLERDKKVYKFGACEKRGQCDAADRKDWEQLARYRGEDSRTMRSIWQERLMKQARQRGEDSKTGRSR
jgi:hypothetical protein